MTDAELPGAFAAIVDDFQALTEPDRLQLLLEFAEGLPDLPERYADHPELLEPVPECQSPVFLVVEVGEAAEGADAPVEVFLSAPRESPTTRGFAGILTEGLAGLTASQVLAVPDDVPHRLGLDRAVSPLRLRGMAGMLGRIKRQVRERVAA
ncbi:MAG TPA: SufE family protein [Actinotalea caeni]|uniref:SufE family protein n=1 Tax=Actinotalea caeni TaxID=1348467 RepID=UPI0012E3269F|nr:SufE family protein [Actinotalea caeni]HLV56211.1 SufE family protein [Actinotalea caeni]